MNENPLKVLEVIASDGKLEVFRQFLVYDKENKPEYLYVLKENGNVIKFDSKSFDKFWKNIVKNYTGIYGWDLMFVHNDLKTTIIKNIRTKIGTEKNWIDNTWREKLCENKQIIDTLDYFDFEYFANQIEIFKRRLDIQAWDYLNLNHSNFKNTVELKKHLLDNQFISLRTPGLYSYFLNDKCIYIGKAKNIQKRIESHYLSSHNLGHHSRGDKHRALFGKYLNEELTMFYTKLDDPFSSRIGEELRITIERLLHLKYKPTFSEIRIVK